MTSACQSNRTWGRGKARLLAPENRLMDLILKKKGVVMQKPSYRSHALRRIQSATHLEKRSKPIEVLQIVVGVAVSASTAIIGWQALMLSSQGAENTKQLAQIEQGLSESRFDFDRTRDVYDRMEKYLDSPVQSAPRGRVLVALINRIPDRSVRAELLAVVVENAKPATIAAAAAKKLQASRDEASGTARDYRSPSSADIGKPAPMPTPSPVPKISDTSIPVAKRSSFSGELRLQSSPDGNSFIVLESYGFTDSKSVHWEVPKGALVDGASIPRSLWSIVGSPFDGRYAAASTLHDYFSTSRTRTKADTDRMFYEALLASGVPNQTASIMYYGTRMGGPSW